MLLQERLPGKKTVPSWLTQLLPGASEQQLLSLMKFLTTHSFVSGPGYFTPVVVSIPLSVATAELRQTGTTVPTSVSSTMREVSIYGQSVTIAIIDGTP
jgi:hypothetical protein